MNILINLLNSAHRSYPFVFHSLTLEISLFSTFCSIEFTSKFTYWLIFMMTHRYDSIVGIEDDTETIDKPKIAIIGKTWIYFDELTAMRKCTGKFSQRKIVIWHWKA